jgi:hypothetical protein
LITPISVRASPPLGGSSWGHNFPGAFFPSTEFNSSSTRLSVLFSRIKVAEYFIQIYISCVTLFTGVLLLMIVSMMPTAEAGEKYVVHLPEGGMLFLRYIEPRGVFRLIGRDADPEADPEAVLEAKSRRVGGATYPVPADVRSQGGTALGLRLLLAAARKRGDKLATIRLAQELRNAQGSKGADVHRMSEASKTFPHHRLF